jgi:hypothetical protein
MDKRERFDPLVARLGFTGAVQQIVDESFADADHRTQGLLGNRQNLPKEGSAILWDDELGYTDSARRVETLHNKTSRRPGPS